MTTTLAASAYFLTCCRPIHNSFCFLIEKPKLINSYHYPLEYFFKHPLSGCKYNHDSLLDHGVNLFNICTDVRGWSLDDRQKRQHFQDIVCGRIPHCGTDESTRERRTKKPEEEKKQKPKPTPVVVKPQVAKETKVLPKGKKDEKTKVLPISGDEDNLFKSAAGPSEEHPTPIPLSSDKSGPELLKKQSSHTGDRLGQSPDQSEEKSSEQKVVSSKIKTPSKKSVESLKEETPPLKDSVQVLDSSKIKPPSKISVQSTDKQSVQSTESSEHKLPSEKSQQSVHSSEQKSPSQKSVTPREPRDVVVLTEELIEKLDQNLHNLESTFDKFVKKNRDFIQNLVECLEFEKQKQKTLEDDYNKLKQENEALKTQNDYLRMVNTKQLELFKNELDRGISENKVIYKRKIHLMERQLQNDQNELQLYKQTEKKYLEVVEQDNEKIEKLNNKIQNLKDKEAQLLNNYLKLLKFLEDVKEILRSNSPNKEIPSMRSVNTITDSGSENDQNVKRVLRNALNNGISTLNVRDLSILHDAIQDRNNHLCHQTDTCGKSVALGSSTADYSISIQRFVIEHSDIDLPKPLEDYEPTSNLSIYPTKQKPEDKRVHFDYT